MLRLMPAVPGRRGGSSPSVGDVVVAVVPPCCCACDYSVLLTVPETGSVAYAV